MNERTATISEMRDRVISKATVDGEFRTQLIADPKAAIEAEIGVDVPAGFTVEVHEDTADISHLILPPSASLGEADLEQVAGGFSWAGVGREPWEL